MSNNNNSIEQRLAALRQSYFVSLPEKINNIKQLSEKAFHDDPEQAALTELQRITHTLSGSGATFGADEISAIAREIDDLALKALKQKRRPDQDEQLKIQDLIEKLIQAVSEASSDIGDLEVSVITRTHDQDRLIYIVEDDKHVANKLAHELVNEDYDVVVFDNLEKFKQAYCSKKPEAVIMDMVFPENSEGGAEIMLEVNEFYQPQPPLIFISNRSDTRARLAAVRAGASRYFTKPLNFEKFIQTLGGLTHKLPHLPYRVLIVDDDQELADYYAVLLNGAGILSKIIINPLEAIDAIDEWEPDLVIMDVYMPECTGLELASIIRQDDKYTTMPIVFLSSEMDTDKQLYALDLGGDAFLTKPVVQQQLLSTVIARVKRSRWLSRLKNELELSLQKNELQRKEIEKKEERLRFSQYFANIGTWDLNIQSREMYWSEKIAPLLGYEKDELVPSYDAFIATVHPDDKNRVDLALEGCTKEGSNYEIEHRIIMRDGSVRWLLQKGDVILNADGQPMRLLGVIQDTTRRKHLERDLATQKEFADQANSAKSEFLSRMSHELRTPLNAIIGFAQLLESDTQQPLQEHQHDSLSEILKAGNHLLELIDEVLDLAKIEAGKIQLNIEEVPVNDILLESYSMMIPMAESQGIQLDFSIESCEDAIINTDRTKLKQVMFNLISNAIKYNKPGGKVNVSCESCGLQRVRLKVKDTGEGIPLEQQSELFKAFSRLGAEMGSIEGTGIGMMISKKIIEMMGGDLGFQSEQGSGCVFWVEMSTLNTVSGRAGNIEVKGAPR